MNTFADRIQKALEARNMKPSDLIRQKVLSKAGVYFLLDGTTTPEKVRETTVAKLCKTLHVSREWLMEGRGDMQRVEPAAGDDEWGDILGYSQAAGLGNGSESQEYAETHKLKFRSDSLAKKRLRPEKLSVFYGKGDSMEPRIKSGDAILFDLSDTQPRDGAVFIIMAGGEYYAKRCMMLDDSVYFTTDNPNGDHKWKKPRRMDAKRDPITIIGRVRWIGSWED